MGAGCGGCWRVSQGTAALPGMRHPPRHGPRKSLHAQPRVGARELPGTRPGRGRLPNTFSPVLFTAVILNEP